MRGRYVSLFWRLLVPNVTVLCVACLVLIIEPANGRIPALAGGFAIMVAANVVLIRRATTPLVRLTELMGEVDPLHPGQRLPGPRAQSELTVLTDAFNDMLDRLETERRESGMRALSEREGERRRVAAELHDQVGQTLTALGLHVDRLLGRSPADLEDEIRDVRDGILGCVDDVRRIARELRPEALDTLGLVAALTNLSERMTQHTDIKIVRRLERDLPSDHRRRRGRDLPHRPGEPHQRGAPRVPDPHRDAIAPRPRWCRAGRLRRRHRLCGQRRAPGRDPRHA